MGFTQRFGLSAVVVAGLLLGVPAKGLAQDTIPATPPVILGLSASAIGDGHEFGLFGGGPTLILPTSPNSALQLTFDLHGQHYSSHVEIDSIYTMQYRHTFGRDLTRPRVFVTIGGAGYQEYSHTDASSYFTPERAKTVSATGVVTSTTPAHWTDVPARTYFDMSLPLAPIAGVGIEGHASPRIGFEASVTASAWPGVAWRFSGGFSIAVGRIK